MSARSAMASSRRTTLRRRIPARFHRVGVKLLDTVEGFVQRNAWSRVVEGASNTRPDGGQTLGVLAALPLPYPHGIAQGLAGGRVLTGLDTLADGAEHVGCHGDADLLGVLHCRTLFITFVDGSIKSDLTPSRVSH